MKGNILDLFLTSAAVNVASLSIESCSHFFLSDHFVITFFPTIHRASSSKIKPTYVLDYSKADYNGMCAYLMDTDFTVCFQSDDIEDIWSTFKSVIYDAISLFIPKMYVKHRKCPKWFNSDIRHHLNCLRTLRRRNKSRPSNNLMQTSEELLKLKMTQAKSNFESKLIESLQSGTTSNIFRYIRNIVGCNDLPVFMSLDSACLSSDPDKASTFNQHFHSIFNQTSFEIPSISDLPQPSTFIGEISIAELDVFNALVSLDPTKSMGIDGIGPSLLKHCAVPLYQVLFHLFSLSLSQHYFPKDWRIHQIKPIFKSGDKTLVKDYRPISLLSCVSKVLERIMSTTISSGL